MNLQTNWVIDIENDAGKYELRITREPGEFVALWAKATPYLGEEVLPSVESKVCMMSPFTLRKLYEEAVTMGLLDENEAFFPDWCSPPIDTVVDIVQMLGHSRPEFYDIMGFDRERGDDFWEGRIPIDNDIADSLERHFLVSASFWLNRQAHYEACMERLEATAMEEE